MSTAVDSIYSITYGHNIHKHEKEIKMKNQTAQKILLKECEFLGIKYELLIADIKKYGQMLYSQKVMEAFLTLNLD